jgi:phage head maturation protease
MRLIPYGVPTQVADVLPNGTLDSYIEEFAPTMFARQVTAGHPDTFHKIRFFDGHPTGDGASKLGWVTALRAEPDWLHGTIRLLPTRIDDVEAMLDSGISDVSVGFIPGAGGTIHRADGSRLRIKGHLDHIALEPEGAYPGAEVLAMRAAQDEADEAELLEATAASTD